MEGSNRRAVIVATWMSGLLMSGCGFFVGTETRLIRATEQLEHGDFRGAEIELKNVLQSEPGNGQARYLLSRVSLELGDAASADKELRFAYDAGFERVKAFELDSRIKLALNQYAELLAAQAPQNLAIDASLRSLFRGRALLGLRRLDEAEAAFKDAFGNGSQSVEAGVGLAEVFAARGDLASALSRLEEVVRIAPDHVEGWLVRGQILLRQQRYQDARQSFEAAQARAEQLTLSRYAILLGLLTESRLATGDTKTAAESHQQMSAIASESPATIYLGARILIAQDNYSAAIAELQRLVSSSPAFIPARLLLGVALLSQGDLQQAGAQLAQVVQAAPDNREARKQLARVRLRLGDSEGAIQALTPALLGAANGEGESRQPGEPELRSLLAEAYQLAGQTSLAQQEYESLLSSGYRTASVLNNLAWLYFVAGDKRAAQTSQEANRLAPDSAAVADTHGWILVEIGQVQEGLKLIEQAAQVLPGDPEVAYHHAAALAKVGRRDEARQRVKALLERHAQFESQAEAKRLAGDLGS